MASTTKVTYTLDAETVARIERLAERTGLPRSGVVREAVAEYAARAGRLSDAERERLLTAFDQLVPRIPRGPAKAAAREIAAIRAARRAGGRERGRRSRPKNG